MVTDEGEKYIQEIYDVNTEEGLECYVQLLTDLYLRLMQA
jgi:hypothetical protein